MPGIRDDKGRTHVDWEVDSVTPRMIDWLWSNLDKAFAQWHRTEHTGFYWAIEPRDGNALARFTLRRSAGRMAP